MKATEGEKIVLGSGKMYIDEYTDSIPEDAVLEVEEKLIGLIQGGASVEYVPTYYVAQDDLGLASKTIITQEEATLKGGIFTWCGKTLGKICSTARVTDDTSTGKRTVKIGGMGNYDGKKYVIRFVHEDPTDGNIRLTIVGNNQSGFSITFAKDKETVINPEFKAQPLDSEGTLIIYEEDIPTA